MRRGRRIEVRPTLVDRVVGYFAPRAGLGRMQARVAMSTLSGFAGARKDRAAMRAWATPVASADADTLPDLDTLRARSRDLVRNDPVAQSAIATKVVNVVGTGSKVLPEIDAARLGLTPGQKEDWEREALAIWNLWAASRDCDVTRVQTFAELEDTVYRTRLLSGDVLALRRYRRRRGGLIGTACQLVEADRLSNPDWKTDDDRLAGGVEMDSDGAPVAYHIASRHPVDRKRQQTRWIRVPAFGSDGRRLVLHIHGPRWRPDMTRYAPLLAPVIESLKQRSRYAEAELMAAVVSACFAVAMKSPEGMMSEGLAAPDGGSAPAGSGQSLRLTEPGQIVDLAPDEELQSFAPGRPTPGYEPFVTAIAREIGAGTDLPQELLLKHFQASYSASRAALEMAWQFFQVDRRHHVDQFCRPFYEDVISEAVAQGLLLAPGFFSDPLVRAAWLGASWVGPARPTLDPVKEAQADKIELENRTTTRSRIAGRKGEDFEQLEAQRQREDAKIGEGSGGGGSGDPPPDDPPDDGGDDDTEES